MMTLKHIELDGREAIYEVSKVWFEPSYKAEYGRSGKTVPDTLHASAAAPSEKDPIKISHGTVFVMNQCGKTVSRYDLGAFEKCGLVATATFA